MLYAHLKIQIYDIWKNTLYILKYITSFKDKRIKKNRLKSYTYSRIRREVLKLIDVRIDFLCFYNIVKFIYGVDSHRVL